MTLKQPMAANTNVEKPSERKLVCTVRETHRFAIADAIAMNGASRNSGMRKVIMFITMYPHKRFEARCRMSPCRVCAVSDRHHSPLRTLLASDIPGVVKFILSVKSISVTIVGASRTHRGCKLKLSGRGGFSSLGGFSLR